MRRGRGVWMRGVRRAGLPYRFVTMDAARRAARALWTLLVGAAIAVLLSALLGRVVALVGTVDFRTEGLPAEILGRTQP